ncbi:HTH domain-containing protein [Mucilaginibacter gynuensis]|uniref:HTH domain-containing protein n=1 Tax=Mucilaginibacter gynuensis TaxID=1302236 RepID=UPI0031EE0101
MDYLTYEKRLYYMLELIQKKRFRSVANTASKFGCSERTVKRMLKHLREKGYHICYDRLEKKYYISS